MSKSQRQAQGHIGLLGAPVVRGQGKTGVDKGPEVLREAGLLSRLQSLGYKVTDHGDLHFEEIQNDPVQWNMKNPINVGRANKKIAEAVTRVVSAGQTCVTLGGDHSLAIGTVSGHAQVNEDLVLVWVDAHADLNPPMASASGNIHGMPVAFLLKELEEYIPKVDAFKWLQPCLTAKDIVYIGLRDVDDAERYLIQQLGIRAYTMRDVDRNGIVRVVQDALLSVNPGLKRPIHLSFDVDGLDPGVTPSTGTPVPGGLTMREGMYIAEELALTNKLAAIDIVEVNPDLGTGGDKDITLNTTLDVISTLFKNRSPDVVPQKV